MTHDDVRIWADLLRDKYGIAWPFDQHEEGE